MTERTTPPIPENLAKNLVIKLSPVTFATVKKSEVGNVMKANSNPIFSIYPMFKSNSKVSKLVYNGML